MSDKNEIFEVAEKVKNEVGDVTILINNAGIAPCRIFQNFNTDEICNVIDVNLMAHYWASSFSKKNKIGLKVCKLYEETSNIIFILLFILHAATTLTHRLHLSCLLKIKDK